MRLLVADLACKNLGNWHSALIISKKLKKKKLKNQQLLRFMREVKSLCKEPWLSWRETYRLKQRSTLSGGRLRAESWAGTSAGKGMSEPWVELLEAHSGLSESSILRTQWQPGVSHTFVNFAIKGWTSISKWTLEKHLHVFLADGGEKDNKLDKAASQMPIKIVAFKKSRCILMNFYNIALWNY